MSPPTRKDRAWLAAVTRRDLAAKGFAIMSMGGNQTAYKRVGVVLGAGAGEVLITSAEADGHAPEGENEPICVSVCGPDQHEPILEMRFANVAAFLACVESFE